MQETKQLTILNTATQGAAGLIFKKAPRDGEYPKPSAYRVALESNVGLPVAATVTFLAGGRPVYIQNALLQISPAGATFVWCIEAAIGLNDINVRLSAAATGNLIFQITAIGD